jgi:hypothetical protein
MARRKLVRPFTLRPDQCEFLDSVVEKGQQSRFVRDALDLAIKLDAKKRKMEGRWIESRSSEKEKD